ncbi:MAG TPA: DUF134 domain-containing protein [Bacteroidales bacterium]|nr:DUF134 domain-containing protein [Bacteroidales bacterium]
MSRPKTKRKMLAPPDFRGYRPFGCHIREQEPVKMLYDEYEAFYLCDYYLLKQAEVAEIMGISRPTVTRIYKSARRKLAKAFAESRVIVIEGGKVYFDSDWYECKQCLSHFTCPGKSAVPIICPLCNSTEIIIYQISRDKKQGLVEKGKK